MAIRNEIEPVFRGEDVLLEFTMSPTVDITGWTIQFFCGLLTVNATITDGPSGNFSVELSRAVTSAWTPGSKKYDVWRTDGSSNVVLSYGSIGVHEAARPAA